MSDNEVSTTSFSLNYDGSLIGIFSGASISTYIVEGSALSARVTIPFATNGVKIFETLPDSHLVALVCVDANGKDVLSIYDVVKKQQIKNLICTSSVTSVFLRHDYVSVVVDTAIYVYSLAQLELVSRVDHHSNQSMPCCAWSVDKLHPVMCSSGLQRGTVRVERYGLATIASTFVAHNSQLLCLGITSNGSFIASCSEKCSLIRIWSSFEGHEMLLEIRRDSAVAPISSLFFSPNGFYLGACTSSRLELFRLSSGSTPAAESSHNSNSSSPAATITNRLSDALRRCVGKASAESVVPLPASRGPVQVVFGTEPLTAVVLLSHGVLLTFKFDASLSSEPSMQRYLRVTGSQVKHKEEHTSEWVMLDEPEERKIVDEQQVPW